MERYGRRGQAKLTDWLFVRQETREHKSDYVNIT